VGTQPQVPARLASEDVIINAPMSYAGSAQRIWRIRRRAQSERALVALTVVAILLVAVVWTLVTSWYLLWGLWLVPYRLLRRGSRKRKAEMMRHRELMGAIQGSAAASAAAVVTATTAQLAAPRPTAQQPSPNERIADYEREYAIAALREHLLAGRLTSSEFDTRVGSLYRCVTRGDLDAVMGDLPISPAVSS
jgi:hypothetical protein